MSNDQAVQGLFTELFQAEQTARELHDKLAARAAGPDRAAVVAEARRATAEALSGSERSDVLRLVCVARLLGELEGDEVVDSLIDVLTSEQPEARGEAGEQLQGLAFDRFKEVALGIERALGRLPVGSPALVELPYLVLEVPEPGVVKLLGKSLEHADADLVGAAIEALVELGDPAAIRLIEPLVDDKRVSVIGDEEEGAPPSATVGELAQEALELLEELAAARA